MPANHVGLRNVPLDDQPVRRRAAMQWTGQRAVDVDAITGADAAQHVKVEMRIRGLKGIERPFDHFSALLKGALALRPLQSLPQTVFAILGQNAEHVRPMRPFAVVANAGHRPDETDEGFARIRRRGQTLASRIPPRLAETISTDAGTVSPSRPHTASWIATTAAAIFEAAQFPISEPIQAPS